MTNTTSSSPAVSKRKNSKTKVEVNDLFKQSNEKESFDPTIEVFMEQVATYKNPEKLKEYIVKELKRIVGLGKSPLKAILQNTGFVDYCGSEIIVECLLNAGVSHTYLRLTDEAVKTASCPERDPHGAIVNPEYRGKVLLVKTGNAGGNIKGEANDMQSRQYTGEGRKALFSTRKAYDIELITEEPKKLSIQKAIIVLSQWGFGVRTKRMIKKDVNVFQDSWLVVEDNIQETYEALMDDGIDDKYLNTI